MFWKKTKSEAPEVGVAESVAASERRDAYRIPVSRDISLQVTVDGVDCRVTNISAGGLALLAPQLLPGQEYSLRLPLPDGSPVIHTRVTVIDRSSRGICRCGFVQLSIPSRDAIHRFILEQEKHRIRNTRVRKAID